MKQCLAFDTETDGLHGPIVIASFCDKMHDEYYVTRPDDIAIGMKHTGTIIGHNLAYDLRALLREGIDWPRCALFDTSVAYHLLDETKQFVGLDFLAKKYLGKDMQKWEDVKDDPEKLRLYAMEDARVTYDVGIILWHELKEQGLFDYFMKVEMPLVPIIADMEHRGIRLDRDEVLRRGQDAAQSLSEKETLLRQLLYDYDQSCPREGCVEGLYHHKKGNKVTECVQCNGTGMNPVLFSSGDVQIDILYRHFGLPVIEYTAKGNKPATDKLVLPRLKDIATQRGNNRAARYIDSLLEFRATDKMISTYYKPWFETGTDRLHPNFHQTGTVSGRWSSSKPNFQNVPPAARPCLVPDEGHAFISVDYTQIELYLLGYLSKETLILEGYERGDDLHEVTGRAIYGEHYGRDTIDPRNGHTHRWNGKTTNFAIVYGLSLRSLAERLGCSQAVAKEIYEKVQDMMPNLDTYKRKVIKDARRMGYCSTILGRRRRLPDLHSDNPSLRGRAERQAINHTIQGSAGDLIKCALRSVMYPGYLWAEPVLQIHDEVLFQVHGDVETHAECLKWLFERAIPGLSPRVETVIMPERWEAK